MVAIKEIISEKKLEEELPFDIVDDAHVHMKNDKEFYRKEYYPTISRIADMHRGPKDFDPKEYIMPMINKGINSYCKKYDIARMPDDIFKNDHRKALFDKIYNEEMEQISQGDYA